MNQNDLNSEYTEIVLDDHKKEWVSPEFNVMDIVEDTEATNTGNNDAGLFS